MGRWRITSQAPGQMATWPGWDVEFVWVWPIERDGKARTVCVGVAAGGAELEEIAEESRRAIDTLGRSAVIAVLDNDEPPNQITITSSGLRSQV